LKEVKIYIRIFIVALALLFCRQYVYAQVDAGITKVEGYVVDDKTNRALPFVNIYFQHTTIGTTSDFDGKYKIKAWQHNDTLVFSMLGYHNVKVYVEHGKKYKLIIRLKENAQTLDEVVITPGENPAHIILRNIIKNKHKNNPEKFSRFNCLIYSVLSAKLINVTSDNLKKILPTLLAKTLPITNDSSGRPVLPLYLSEKISDKYINRDDRIAQSKVIRKKVKAIMDFADFDIEGYDNSLNNEMNFYKNFVALFGHTFISPLARNGLAFYKYYLEDSTFSNGRTYYDIKFVPRHKKDLAFTGNFVVVKGLWAITIINATLPKSANINYINTFKVSCNFDFINDSTLFFKKNTFKGNFHYFKIKNQDKNMMIEFDKTTHYSNVLLGKNAQPIPDTISAVSVESLDSSFLTYGRTPNIKNFVNTSKIIDSTNNLWWINAGRNIINMFISGYFTMGKIDLGPYLGTFSRNSIEGTRLDFGLRTSENFNSYYSLGGNIGYGFKDKQWKYSLYGQYQPKTKHRTIIGGSIIKDLCLFGAFSHIRLIKENMLFTGEDSFIAAAFKRYQSNRRAMSYQYNVYVEKDLRRGFMTRLSYQYNKLQQGLYVPFIHNQVSVNYIYNYALSLRLRFSWKEKISDIYLRRYYLSTYYPIVNIVGTVGKYSVNSENNKYVKLYLCIKHKVPFGFMSLKYVVEAGYIFGKVPFPLLDIIRGNETYGDSKYRFNLLNNATVAFDKFASVLVEHHFNGLIMNKIPFIKALNIRIVASAKYFIGKLSNKHKEILEYPWNMHIPGNQYFELGVGLENILQIFRVEAIWRLVPKVYFGLPYFGVRVRADFAM